MISILEVYFKSKIEDMFFHPTITKIQIKFNSRTSCQCSVKFIIQIIVICILAVGMKMFRINIYVIFPNEYDNCSDIQMLGYNVNIRIELDVLVCVLHLLIVVILVLFIERSFEADSLDTYMYVHVSILPLNFLWPVVLVCVDNVLNVLSSLFPVLNHFLFIHVHNNVTSFRQIRVLDNVYAKSIMAVAD